MATYLLRYKTLENIKWGIIENDNILPLTTDVKTLGDLLRLGINQLKKENAIPLSSVEVLSPVTPDAKILAQGLNYRKHAIESGVNPDKLGFNMIFHKASSALAPANTNIIRPKGVKLLDYEIELGLIIKKKISEPLVITKDNLPDYLAGIVMVNDVSARDIQIPQGQWFKGKAYRTFCPCGPYIALFEAEDFHMINNLELRLEVNGQLRQSANTSEFIVKPEQTLTELSSIIDLNPGDMVITGTPSGVAVQAPSKFIQWISNVLFSEKKRMELFVKMQAKTGRYLNNGDVIKSNIKSTDGSLDLGIQENKVV